MNGINKPREDDQTSTISPSTVIKGALILGIGALLVTSLSRQESTKREFTERIAILEERLQALSDTVVMMEMNKTTSAPRKEQSNVFVSTTRKPKQRNFD
jgi:hypothetical protein